MQCLSQTVQLQTNGGAHWHGDKSQQCIICDTRFEHISGSTGSSICKSVIPIPAMMYACKDQEEAITVLPLWRGSYIHQSNEKAQVIQPQIVFFICASCGKQFHPRSHIKAYTIQPQNYIFHECLIWPILLPRKYLCVMWQKRLPRPISPTK